MHCRRSGHTLSRRFNRPTDSSHQVVRSPLGRLTVDPRDFEATAARITGATYCRRFGSALYASGVGRLLFPAPGDVLPNMPHTNCMTACVEDYFREGWHLKDERNGGIPTLLRTGIADDFDAMSVERIRRHPYYQEYLASHGLQCQGPGWRQAMDPLDPKGDGSTALLAGREKAPCEARAHTAKQCRDLESAGADGCRRGP
jgi:hypothetical protein